MVKPVASQTESPTKHRSLTKVVQLARIQRGHKIVEEIGGILPLNRERPPIRRRDCFRAVDNGVS